MTAANDYPVCQVSPPVGGRLSLFKEAWGRVTSDKWVLETISSGYQLEFTHPPPSTRVFRRTSLPKDPIKKETLLSEVQALLQKGAIERVSPRRDLIMSTFFLTVKKSGEWHPILNLKPLNALIKPKNFCMETLAAVIRELHTGWWGATLDLKDAYLHIPVKLSDRKWLGFCIGSQNYRYKVLPFGLSTVPRTFTRAEYLRQRGIFVYVYLDDWLITAPSPGILRQQIQSVSQLFTSLGLLINARKSALVPSQQIQFLGANLLCAEGKAVPTEERVTATAGCAAGLLAAEISPARQWMRLLGLIASLTAILPQCRLHMRVIQLHVLSRFNLRRHPLSTPIPSSRKIRKELRWWTHPHNLKPGQPFSPQTPCSCLTTDASKAGWGAHWGDIMLSGRWTPAIAKLHINRLELLAIHLALRRLLQQVKGQTVKVRCDNLSVVNMQQITTSPNSQAAHLVPAPRDTAPSRTSPRGGQQASGCSIQGGNRPSDTEKSQRDLGGMAAEQSSVPDSIQSAGETIHRPMCDKGEQPATSLLHEGSGPHGLRSGCHDHQLEQDAGLCVSSHRSDTQGPGETLKIQELQDASNSPAVAQANVVPGAAVSSGSQADQPASD